ncbi:hypothetical protein BCR44DRAFT_85988 [Catenaria anguillulae PL171]|uniref:Uncharacterized protein n=1 Tax=Catenaria anguillulae PL171 TaxID=765915 RepID=A0A1Y2HMT0_9FUNG|nr:hypothetical protein BCR44DRAFT_85988 [Catenaria anguillulae PL171]
MTKNKVKSKANRAKTGGSGSKPSAAAKAAQKTQGQAKASSAAAAAAGAHQQRMAPNPNRSSEPTAASSTDSSGLPGPNLNGHHVTLTQLPPRALQSLAHFLLGPRPSPYLYSAPSSSLSSQIPSPLPLAFTCKHLHDLIFSTEHLWLTPTPRSLLLCPGSSLVWHPPISSLPEGVSLASPSSTSNNPWPKNWHPWSLDLSRLTRVEYIALLRRAHASIRNKVAHVALPPYATTTDSFRPAALLSLILHSGAFPSLCAVSIPYWTLRGLPRWDDVGLSRLQHPVRLIIQGHPPGHAVPSFDALLDVWVDRMQPFLDALVQAAATAAASSPPTASSAAAKLALPHIPSSSPFLSWSKCRTCKARYASPSPCTPVDPELMASPASIKSYPAASPKGQLDARDPSVTLTALNQLYQGHTLSHVECANGAACKGHHHASAPSGSHLSVSSNVLPPPARCEHVATHVNGGKPRPTTRLIASSSSPPWSPSMLGEDPTSSLSASGFGASCPSPWSSPCCALIARNTCYTCLYQSESLAQQCVHCYAVLCEDHMVLDRYDCIHCGALIEQYTCPSCYAHHPRHTITCVDCGEALCEACIDEAYPCTCCDQLLCLECAEHMLAPMTVSAAAAAADHGNAEDVDGPPPLLPADAGEPDADTVSIDGGVGPADHQSEAAGKVMCLDCTAYVRAASEEAAAAAAQGAAFDLGPEYPEAVTDEDAGSYEDYDEDEDEVDEDEHLGDHASCDHCRAAAAAAAAMVPAATGKSTAGSASTGSMTTVNAKGAGKSKQPVYIEVQHYDDDGKLIETKTTQYMVDKATIENAAKRVQAATAASSATAGKQQQPASSAAAKVANGAPATSSSKKAQGMQPSTATSASTASTSAPAQPAPAEEEECACKECTAYRQKEHQAMAVLKAMMSAGGTGPLPSSGSKSSSSTSSRKATAAQAAAAKAAGLSPAEAQAFVDRLNLAMEELSAASMRVAAEQQAAGGAHEHGGTGTGASPTAAAAAAAAAAMMSGDLPPAIAAMIESVGSRIGAAAAAASASGGASSSSSSLSGSTGNSKGAGINSTQGGKAAATASFTIGDAAWNAMIASVPLPPYSTSSAGGTSGGSTATTAIAGEATLTAANMEDLFADPDTFGSVLARLAMAGGGGATGASTIAGGSIAFGPMPAGGSGSGGVFDPTAAGVIGFGGFVGTAATDASGRPIVGADYQSTAKRALKDMLRDFITTGSTAPVAGAGAGTGTAGRGGGKHSSGGK